MYAATSACYSRRDARRPLIAAAVRVSLTFVGMFVALTVGNGVVVLAILCLGISVADLLAGFGLHRSLQRSIPVLCSSAKGFVQPASIGIAIFAVGVGAASATLARSVGLPGRFTEAVVGAGVVIVVYLALQRARHSSELDELIAVFRKPQDA